MASKVASQPRAMQHDITLTATLVHEGVSHRLVARSIVGRTTSGTVMIDRAPLTIAKTNASRAESPIHARSASSANHRREASSVRPQLVEIAAHVVHRQSVHAGTAVASPWRMPLVPGVPTTITAGPVRDEQFIRRLRSGRWGVVLALITILFGFGLGGAFGAFEAPLKADLTERAHAVRDTVYGGDTARMKSVVDKSWTYYKRAHMHGGAIGVVALAGILLLASLHRPRPSTRRAISLALGIGGLGYAMFWLLAAREAPRLGGTDAAKESLSWLAVPSAGLLLAGVAAIITLTCIELFARPSGPASLQSP
jgi:hypothetical protein